jgi:hypothetical protein
MGFVHLALALDLCSNDKRYLTFYFRATIEEPALCGFFLLFYWNEKVRTAFIITFKPLMRHKPLLYSRGDYSF